ncbi:hypothetical protein P154DRAFT_353561 [Amniculicola lignicola CBS 123094]|uniref:Uncharacterized protein n=1 Tax=Amniculicola lignicola CBS 123094 TaxID=1392246 RepID=A0A6A5WWM1_9PLEO|nr:hypothetical protein P154DRAFT_353561 [Amniculicola lignicola CBS 123094]
MNDDSNTWGRGSIAVRMCRVNCLRPVQSRGLHDSTMLMLDVQKLGKQHKHLQRERRALRWHLTRMAKEQIHAETQRGKSSQLQPRPTMPTRLLETSWEMTKHEELVRRASLGEVVARWAVLSWREGIASLAGAYHWGGELRWQLFSEDRETRSGRNTGPQRVLARR